MGTLVHKIEYLSCDTLVTHAVWIGPLGGIIDIARANIVKNGADAGMGSWWVVS